MKQTSKIWEYFDKLSNEKGKCKQCTKEISCEDGSTTGMRKHLQSIHKAHYEELLKSAPLKRKNAESNDGSPAKTKQLKIDFAESNLGEKQKSFDENLMSFIADTGVPFSVTSSESFRNLIKSANRNIVVKHRTVQSRHIRNKHEEILSKVASILNHCAIDLDAIAFTTDLWVSKSLNSYLSLTMTFIDNTFHLHRYVPFVKSFDLPHKGVNISLALSEMIGCLVQDNNIFKLFAVSDNASNMKVCMRALTDVEESFCVLHTLQLSIKDTFKTVHGMSAILKMAKKIAKYVNKSSTALSELKEAALCSGVHWKRPKNPNCTRWNSQYDNMASILPFKNVLDELSYKKKNWASMKLEENDWGLLEGACEVLGEVKNVTKTLEPEESPTINLVIERIYTLDVKLQQFVTNRGNIRNNRGVMFASVLRRKLNERFPAKGSNSSLYRYGNLLDPRTKGIHLAGEGKLKATRDELEVLWDHLNKEANDSETKEATIQSEDAAVNLSPTSELRRRLAINRVEESYMEPSKIRKELILYEKFSTPPKSFDVLTWWRNHKDVLPILSRLARLFLSVPASSAQSERTFSFGGNFVTQKRTRLNPKKVEELTVIKANEKRVNRFIQNDTSFPIKKFKKLCELEISEIPFVEQDVPTSDSSSEEELESDPESYE